jgi:hypothetical protein
LKLWPSLIRFSYKINDSDPIDPLIANAAQAHEDLHTTQTFQFAKGDARNWVVMGEDHKTPLAVGVGINEAAISSVTGFHGVNLSMPLPVKGDGIVIDHVYLGWMPEGHPPAGIFSVPHFDVHFYLTSKAERESILPEDPDFMKKGAHYPDPVFVPAGYVPPPEPDPIPQMGFHYVDTTGDVFKGKPFTEVFLYGGWDGEINFLEPMITLDVFRSRKTIISKIKQPGRYPQPGYYPTQYRISFDKTLKEHQVVLEQFVWRK